MVWRRTRPVRRHPGAGDRERDHSLDARLKPASKVTGRIVGAAIPFRYDTVNVHNARTGDYAGPDGADQVG
ncbi:hypothetical protein GCM10010452_57260 [Crossiella cryophila]